MNVKSAVFEFGFVRNAGESGGKVHSSRAGRWIPRGLRRNVRINELLRTDVGLVCRHETRMRSIIGGYRL